MGATPAQKEIRPLLPERRACRQIDTSLLIYQPERFPRSRAERRLIQKERSIELLDHFPIAQTTADTFCQRVLDPFAR